MTAYRPEALIISILKLFINDWINFNMQSLMTGRTHSAYVYVEEVSQLLYVYLGMAGTTHKVTDF